MADRKVNRMDIYKVGIITLSDKGSKGQRVDESGPLIEKLLKAAGPYQVEKSLLLPDDQKLLEDALIRMCDEDGLHLILTTGGTGLSPRDVTPEATMAVATRNVPGIAEYLRVQSFAVTPKAMLGRGVSVMRGKTLIVNLPGSPKAVKENMEFLLPALSHGLDIMLGRDGECGSSAPRKPGRDVSFMTAGAAAWLKGEAAESVPEDGLCLKRFKADHIVESLDGYEEGDVLTVDGEEFVLTRIGKPCHQECPLRQRTGHSCRLAGEVAFGVISSTEK